MECPDDPWVENVACRGHIILRLSTVHFFSLLLFLPGIVNHYDMVIE